MKRPLLCESETGGLRLPVSTLDIFIVLTIYLTMALEPPRDNPEQIQLTEAALPSDKPTDDKPVSIVVEERIIDGRQAFVDVAGGSVMSETELVTRAGREGKGITFVQPQNPTLESLVAAATKAGVPLASGIQVRAP